MQKIDIFSEEHNLNTFINMKKIYKGQKSWLNLSNYLRILYVISSYLIIILWPEYSMPMWPACYVKPVLLHVVDVNIVSEVNQWPDQGDEDDGLACPRR